ncbi:NADH-quinone oxidoreductase subunit C [Amycolatopsis sp. WGS_07]|uniref:hydrogenase large subunit n=1 Tax=Amycolatopsis sp. WGS_07 TaxID=3076764 RepID=UPI003873ABC9
MNVRDVTPAELPAAAESLLAEGFRVALVSGHDDGDQLRAVYLFLAEGNRRAELQVRLPAADPRLPSLARLSFPAGRFEREMRDLFGIVPEDHPLPRRLVRHFHWPRGWYPMRAGAGAPPEFGEVAGPYPFRAVEGPGVSEIPVGPVHAGMIEPGHFRFSVAGETILNLKARLWFVHKGLEALFAGRAPDAGIELAERISGDTAVGHALAYCLAVEDALGLEVSADAARVRAVLLELERIHNHVADLGALCNDVGHSVLNSHAQVVREKLLRHNEEVAGHRLLRGGVRLGGARLARLPDPAKVRALAAEAGEIAALAVEHSVVRDRFAGTAVLSPQQAADLGTLGYVARASGLRRDARYEHPFLDLGEPVEHTRTDGDVLSRFLVRAEEISHSAALVERLTGSLGSQSALAGSAGSGVGVAEGWRGTIVHRVELSGGVLTRVKAVDPSFFNWPALPVALVDTIVPDFPLANKSFNLSYAGNDL